MNEKLTNGGHGFSNASLLPQEEQLDTAIRRRKISIGIPNDKKNDEKKYKTPFYSKKNQIKLDKV